MAPQVKASSDLDLLIVAFSLFSGVLIEFAGAAEIWALVLVKVAPLISNETD